SLNEKKGKSTPSHAEPEAESGSEFPLGTETATVGQPASEPADKPVDSNNMPMSEVEFNARVARKAFELFERRGGDSGRDVEDWLEAERMVRDEILKESEP
ncbi:MAG TPA: DUF2934 domain-containing protein, partial [Nitrospiraceae bacterium]|nr:DUF2934 domain-containing protein [Nitrospiraceae bacterium]